MDHIDKIRTLDLQSLLPTYEIFRHIKKLQCFFLILKVVLEKYNLKPTLLIWAFIEGLQYL
jgi:hypothetical protein